EPFVTFAGHNDWLGHLVFSDNGKFLAYISQDNAVKLWDLTRKGEIATLRLSDWASSVNFSPDGKTLAIASHAGAVKLWSLSSFRELMTLPEQVGPNSDLGFTYGAQALLCISGEDKI